MAIVTNIMKSYRVEVEYEIKHENDERAKGEFAHEIADLISEKMFDMEHQINTLYKENDRLKTLLKQNGIKQ